MRLPINEKYSTNQSTGIGASKSGISSQSSEEMYSRNYKPNIFATRTMKKKDPGQEAKDKIKSKLFVLNESKEKEGKRLKIPKKLIAPPKENKQSEKFRIKDKKGELVKVGKGNRYDEKHFHLHLYHHFAHKDRNNANNTNTNETEPSKQTSKVSGVGPKIRSHTESRDGDTDTTAEVAAVSGVNEMKRNPKANKYFKDSTEDKHKKKRKSQGKHINYENSKEDQESSMGDDVYDEEVLDAIVSLGYPIEEVIRLIEEEDEAMVNLYLSLLQENHNHLKAIYPSYMRSKAADYHKYAFLLASPENSNSRTRKDKSRNNRVLSYSPKRNKGYPHGSKGSMTGSGENNAVRFSFYPKDNQNSREDAESLVRNRKLLGSRNFSPN